MIKLFSLKQQKESDAAAAASSGQKIPAGQIRMQKGEGLVVPPALHSRGLGCATHYRIAVLVPHRKRAPSSQM